MLFLFCLSSKKREACLRSQARQCSGLVYCKYLRGIIHSDALISGHNTHVTVNIHLKLSERDKMKNPTPISASKSDKRK